ncbi:MAG: multiheme c-type cytochrome [Sandaracinus sp.]
MPFALGIGLVACAAPPPSVGASAPRLASGDAGSADAGSVDAAPTALPARFERCARCHEDAAAEHAASMHASAFDDPLFQREWGAALGDGERSPRCVACHAPLARDASDPRAHEGVGCASCHVREGRIESVHASGRAPHETRVVAEDVLTTDRCAPCHEFAFPSRHDHPEAMQRTVSEWRSGGAIASCAGCHMPDRARGVRAGRSHDVLGGRDPALTAEALDLRVTARLEGRATIVEARLVTRAGHAVPTGDLYRRVIFAVTGTGGARAEAELSRLFALDEDGERREIADQRVLPSAERVLRFVLPGRAREVRWALTWHALPERAPLVEGIPRAMREQTWARGRVRVEPPLSPRGPIRGPLHRE